MAQTHVILETMSRMPAHQGHHVIIMLSRECGQQLTPRHGAGVIAASDHEVFQKCAVLQSFMETQQLLASIHVENSQLPQLSKLQAFVITCLQAS